MAYVMTHDPGERAISIINAFPPGGTLHFLLLALPGTGSFISPPFLIPLPNGEMSIEALLSSLPCLVVSLLLCYCQRLQSVLCILFGEGVPWHTPKYAMGDCHGQIKV